MRGLFRAAANLALEREQESPAINAILRFPQSARAGREIEGSGNGADAAQNISSSITEFSGELEREISTQRKAGQKQRQSARALALPQNVQHVAGLSGMIIRQRQRFGTAAASQIQAMRGESGFERGADQAARVHGRAGAFESMNQHQLGAGLDVRGLRM